KKGVEAFANAAATAQAERQDAVEKGYAQSLAKWSNTHPASIESLLANVEKAADATSIRTLRRVWCTYAAAVVDPEVSAEPEFQRVAESAQAVLCTAESRIAFWKWARTTGKWAAGVAAVVAAGIIEETIR